MLRPNIEAVIKNSLDGHLSAASKKQAGEEPPRPTNDEDSDSDESTPRNASFPSKRRPIKRRKPEVNAMHVST
jgi:hypothetical protein